jgi:predicted nucleic acid-binding protein
LIVYEGKRSDECRDLIRRDRQVVACELTELEAFATVQRYVKDHRVASGEVRAVGERLELAVKSWEMIPLDSLLLVRAKIVSRTHALRAADCLQLAAAKAWAGRYTKGKGFVSADGALLDAADREGFTVFSVDKRTA